MKIIYRILALTFSLWLVGCNTMRPPNLANNNGFTQAPSFYLQQAQQASGITKQNLLLRATAAYFYYGNFTAGRQSLYQVKLRQLDDLHKAQYQLLNARLALYDQQPQRALDVLNMIINNPIMSTTMQAEVLQLEATAQQRLNLTLDSIKTRIQLTPLLTTPTVKDENQRTIWHTLSKITSETLAQLQQDSSNSILQGWAALALITRNYANNPPQLLQQLRNWQNQFAKHPAHNLVTTDINKFALLLQAPQQVALLLPLQGPVGPQAEAILNGFLIAYYQAKAQNLPVPTLKIYDTSTTAVSTQYQKAIANGANFVIGPLTKANVELLKSDADISVPTLALNYDTDNDASPNNFYEFALSPINEATAITTRAAQLGYINSIAITPAGKWGNNIATHFTQQWQSYDGNLLDTISYKPKENLKAMVASFLHITQSYIRRNSLQKIIGEKVKFSARRRQDIDFIFLNAFPQQARQIMPLLRFYYAGNIPVFSTSQIYNGNRNPQRDRDLDDIQFPIMPWIINPSANAQKLRQQARTLWSSNFKQYSTLYAFGIDTYNLMIRMNQLQALPKFGLIANTGTLFMQTDRRIYRQLEWAQFVKGAPKLLAKNDNIIAPLPKNP